MKINTMYLERALELAELHHGVLGNAFISALAQMVADDDIDIATAQDITSLAGKYSYHFEKLANEESAHG